MKLSGNTLQLLTTTSLLAITYLFLSVLHSHTKLVEDRGVLDDICYLRQAYLFRTHGVIGGLDTDNSSARYADALIKKMGFNGKLSSYIPCHNLHEATNKLSMQYPPGTGFLLSAFPEGSQASGLYIASSTTIFLMLIWLIATSVSPLAVGVFTIMGSLTLYLMVNPAKASYSIAPTMPLCLAMAYLTVMMFSEKSPLPKVILAASAGLLLGFATDIRLSSVLLAIGYAIIFAVDFIRNRTWATLFQPIAFGVSLVLGATPTLAANVINGGSPFATAYRGVDVAPPLTSVDPLIAQMKWYLLSQTHSVLTWLSLVLVLVLLTYVIKRKLARLQPPLLIAITTLVTNDIYFITHPVQSQYYTVPPAMLTLWISTFVLASWINSRETAQSFLKISRASAAVGTTALITAVTLLAYDGMFSRPKFAPSVDIESHAIIWIGSNKWAEAWKAHGLALAF